VEKSLFSLDCGCSASESIGTVYDYIETPLLILFRYIVDDCVRILHQVRIAVCRVYQSTSLIFVIITIYYYCCCSTISQQKKNGKSWSNRKILQALKPNSPSRATKTILLFDIGQLETCAAFDCADDKGIILYCILYLRFQLVTTGILLHADS
jgi:hypothetical protein